MKKLYILTAVLLGAVVLNAQALDREINTLMSKYALFEITNAYFTAIESLYPERATRAGLESASDLLDERDAAAQNKRVESAARIKIMLDKIKYKKLTPSERTDYEILTRTLQYDNYLLSRNRYATSPMYYLEAQDAVYDTMLKKMNGLRQYKDIQPRLIYLPAIYKDGVVNLKNSSKKEAALAINKAYAAYTTMEDYHAFLKRNANDPVAAQDLDKLLKENRTNLRNFFNFAKALESAAKPDRKNDYAYRMTLKNKLHIDKTIAELNKIAEKDIAKRQANLFTVIKAVKNTNKAVAVKDFYTIEAALNNAPKYENLLKTIADEIETANKAMKDALPAADMKVFVSHMPKYTAFLNPAYMFLPPYGVEHNLIGTLFINTPEDRAQRDAHIKKHFNMSRIKMLVTETVVPGKQMFYSYSYDTKPIRRVLASDSMVDGWAVYAKHLAFEQGYLSTKEDALFLAFEDFKRAVAVLADIKFNTGELDYDETILFAMSQGLNQADAEAVTRMAAFTPGQIVSEYLAYNEIKEQRKKYEESQGKNFNLAQFHNNLFFIGKVPVGMLDAELKNAYKKNKNLGFGLYNPKGLM